MSSLTSAEQSTHIYITLMDAPEALEGRIWPRTSFLTISSNLYDLYRFEHLDITLRTILTLSGTTGGPPGLSRTGSGIPRGYQDFSRWAPGGT